MATKISNLSAETSMDGADEVAFSDGASATKKITVTNLRTDVLGGLTDQTDITTGADVADELLIYDTDATAIKKISLENLIEYALQSGVINTDVALWKSITLDSTRLVTSGITNAPGRTATTGLLVFDASTLENVYALIQMPRDWKEGTAISPVFEWTKTTSASGNVAWRIQYQHIPVAGTGPGTFTSNGINSTVGAGTTDGNTAWQHLRTPASDITMTGYVVGHTMLLQIQRVATDASDTYAADARLLALNINYQANALGSIGEFDKDGV